MDSSVGPSRPGKDNLDKMNVQTHHENYPTVQLGVEQVQFQSFAPESKQMLDEKRIITYHTELGHVEHAFYCSVKGLKPGLSND